MKLKGLNGLIELYYNCEDKHNLALLFNLFFTDEEKQALSQRYLIVRELLNHKKTQREIAKDLNVSIAKITRGSNELKRTDRELIKYLQEKMR